MLYVKKQQEPYYNLTPPTPTPISSYSDLPHLSRVKGSCITEGGVLRRQMYLFVCITVFIKPTNHKDCYI